MIPGVLHVSSMDPQLPVGSSVKEERAVILHHAFLGAGIYTVFSLPEEKPLMGVAVSSRHLHSSKCEVPRWGGGQRDERLATKKMSSSTLTLQPCAAPRRWTPRTGWRRKL